MPGIVSNAAFWASLAALLAALGIEIRFLSEVGTHVLEIVAAITAIVGIFASGREHERIRKGE